MLVVASTDAVMVTEVAAAAVSAADEELPSTTFSFPFSPLEALAVIFGSKIATSSGENSCVRNSPSSKGTPPLLAKLTFIVGENVENTKEGVRTVLHPKEASVPCSEVGKHDWESLLNHLIVFSLILKLFPEGCIFLPELAGVLQFFFQSLVLLGERF